MGRLTERRIVEPVAGAEPAVGRWLWTLADTRRRTLAAVAGISQTALDRSPFPGANSVATLLYHVALIEADYLYADVLELHEAGFPQAIVALFPVGDRDEAGLLSAVAGTTLGQHLARLAAVRADLLATFGAMDLADFRRPRTLPEYEITPEWTLHHLVQHEAEHRGQMLALRESAERETHAAP